jgi:peptidoglycan/xylan/chitin deacetylase (PgdA/CDA1 family)
MKYPKRDLLADISRFSGVTRVLAALPQRPLLLVLDYHRIGEPSETSYDAEVFSARPHELDAQIAFWKRRFHVATLDEAVDMVERPRNQRGTSILFTFDDGYVDNFQSAFPILASHGVQGVFFLPTSFIGTNRLSWWDQIAYIIRHSRRARIRLTTPPCEFDLGANGVNAVIARVLDLYRTTSESRSEAFLAQIEEACDSPRPDGSQRTFMNWDEAAAMARGGMAIGSHTHSHEILSRLPEEDQFRELATSRAILEERLGMPVYSLSYPVGLPQCFSTATQMAAQRAGYRIAFSFYGGFNAPGAIQRFDVLRQGVVFGRSLGRYQLQGTLAAVTAKYWF